MVEADIIEYSNFGPEQRNRTVAFIDLGDKHSARICGFVANPRAGEWRIVSYEILHYRAVHDRRVHTCIGQYPADHAGHGRFATSAANRNAVRGGVEQFGQQFGAGHPLATEFVRFGDIGNAVFNRRRSDQDLVAAYKSAAVLGEQVDAKALQPFEFGSQPALVERTVGTCNGCTCVTDDIGQG